MRGTNQRSPKLIKTDHISLRSGAGWGWGETDRLEAGEKKGIFFFYSPLEQRLRFGWVLGIGMVVECSHIHDSSVYSRYQVPGTRRIGGTPQRQVALRTRIRSHPLEWMIATFKPHTFRQRRALGKPKPHPILLYYSSYIVDVL